MTYRKTMVLLLGTVAAASLAGATPKEEAVAGLRESFSRRTPHIARKSALENAGIPEAAG